MNVSAGAGGGGGADSLVSTLGAQIQGQGLGLGLGALALWLAWRVLRCVLPRLLARYDARAQRPPHPAPAEAVQALLKSPAAAALLAWCFAGAGSGATPWWRPGGRPDVGQRLALAVTAVVGQAARSGPAFESDAAALAHAVALHLDGSLQLQAVGGRWGGLRLRLRLRLRTKACDACWWRVRQPHDPWDAGYVLNEADTPRQLAHFRPRRASLLVADGLPLAQTLACAQALATHQAAFNHPVRLLIVATPDTAAALRAAALESRVSLTWFAAAGGVVDSTHGRAFQAENAAMFALKSACPPKCSIQKSTKARTRAGNCLRLG